MRAWQWVAGIVAGLGTLAVVSSTSEEETEDGGATPPPPQPPRPPFVGPAVAGMPQGKGVFVRSVAHGGGPELFAQRMAYLGMRHVFVQSMFHEKAAKRVNDQSRYAEYGDALRKVGCEPWVWGFPRPDSIDEFVAVSIAAMDKLGAPGLLMNVESAFIGEPEAALELVEKCRAALGGRPLGLTTYGAGPGRIKGYPWDAFASVDFVVPQWYDINNNLDSGYPMRGFGRYSAAGHKVMVAGWSAMKQHPPRLMAQMASESPVPSGAVCWWDLHWILQSKERAEWVRAYQIPSPGGSAVA